MAEQNEDEVRAIPLHPSTKQRVRAVRFGLSLDGWAVIVALVLAAAVKFGAKVPW